MWWITAAQALTLDAAVVGTELTIEITGASPSASVKLLASALGQGPGPCPVALGGTCVDLLRVDRVFTLSTDASGQASVLVPAPALDTLWLQAVQVGPVELSPVVDLSLVPQVVSLDCAPHVDNVLRYDCTVLLDRPAAVELEWTDGLGEPVVERSDATEQLEHTFAVWGMWADDTFTVRARGGTGDPASIEVTTDPLPVGPDLDLAVSGSTEAGPFLFNMGCDGTDELVVVDGVGRVRWYQDVADLSPSAVVTRGFALTPHGTVLVLVDRYEVAELAFDGTLLWSTPVADPLHHEVLWWGDKVAAIDARAVPFPNGLTYVMDGVQWFDAQGSPLTYFPHEDVVDPQVVTGGGGYWNPVFSGAIDWAHVNALGMGDDGTGVLSLKAIDALHKVVLDPDAPDFGDLVWTLTGKAGSPLVSDLARFSSTGVSPITFGDQHHVTVLADDELLFLDNQPGGPQLSRVLRIVVDEAAGTADLVESWPLNRRCPGQGSAVLLDSGNVIADCAAADTLLEIEAGTGAELWSMTASCPSGVTPPRPLYRALVVDGW